jgi:hypothetical protein
MLREGFTTPDNAKKRPAFLAFYEINIMVFSAFSANSAVNYYKTKKECLYGNRIRNPTTYP